MTQPEDLPGGCGNILLSDHPLANRKTVRTADLAGETLLLSKVDCSYGRLLLGALAEEKVAPGLVHELYSVAALMEFAAAGLGVTVLPEEALAWGPKRGGLVELSWDTELETAS